MALALAACSTEKTVSPRISDAPAIGPASHDVMPFPPLRSVFSYMLVDLPTQPQSTPQNHELHHTALVDQVGPLSQFNARFGAPDLVGNKTIAMITTFGSTTAQCSSVGPNRFINEARVFTTCLDMPNGTSVWPKFSVLLVGLGASLPAPLAFAYADQPTVASYAPDTARSYTTGTGAMLVERIGVGDWYVHLGTGNPQGSMFHVNSSDANSVCTVAEWKNFGIRARCFNRTGTPADVPYRVLQMSRGRPDSAAFGFAWADQRSLSTPYVPARSFYKNSHGAVGTVNVVRAGVGRYSVEFRGAYPQDVFRENIQVTPFSSIFVACTVVDAIQGDNAGSWSHVDTVECRDARGALIDSRFNISLVG